MANHFSQDDNTPINEVPSGNSVARCYNAQVALVRTMTENCNFADVKVAPFRLDGGLEAVHMLKQK